MSTEEVKPVIGEDQPIATPPFDTSIVDAPTLDTPTFDTPILDTPVPDTSTLDTPILDTPTLGTPLLETPTLDTPIFEIPMHEIPTEPAGKSPTPERTWVEEIEIAGGQLVESLKELIAEGKVRRLIIRTAEDKVMLEIPLTAGVAVGGVVTFFAPVLAALGALAALLTRVKVQIVRAAE